MSYAPIALFTYNRVSHTKATLEALVKNPLAKESELFVFSDGARKEADLPLLKEIRTLARDYPEFKKETVFEKTENKGLADSIVAGVTDLVNTYGKVIVLEDDIVTSPYFLQYMNTALDTYEHDTEVMEISGYCLPLKTSLPETYFLDRTTSWGWATWKRAWDHFETDSHTLIAKLKAKPNGLKNFNLDGNYNFMSGLKANADGKVKTWAVKWQAVVTLNDGLVLWPNASLIKNYGLDGTGENCDEDKTFDSPLTNHSIGVTRQPITLNKEVMVKVSAFYNSIRLPLTTRIVNKIKSVWK